MEISQHKKTAILFGATGLVGGECLQQLLRHPAYQRVQCFVRRRMDLEHPKLEQHIIDFDRLEDARSLMRGQDVFSCLGTTMAKAGSREAFWKVDYTYAIESARIACDQGASQLMLVSSVGAHPDSLFYYSRVKGAVEEAARELPYWSLHIFQPSVLLGDRRERRLGEQLAGAVMGKASRLIARTSWKAYRPVEAETVASAMIVAAQRLEPGQFVYPSDKIYEMGQSTRRLA